MNAEEYGAMKQRLIQLVPRHSIVVSLPKKLIVQAQTGGYLAFRHMVMDAELLEGMPQQTIDMLHNKLIVQWGPEAEGDHWVNLGRYLNGLETDIPRMAKDAIGWLNGIAVINEVLGID